MNRIALFSAANKTPQMVEFAKGLISRGFIIWASGGTFKYLQGEGVEAVDIATIVGEPILNHRVVSLSREIFAGLLADLRAPVQFEEIGKLIGGVIEIAYVDLYPLQEAIDALLKVEKRNRDWSPLREMIDIGGPSLLRAASKGKRYAVSSLEQFAKVLEALDMGDTERASLLRDKLRHQLAQFAEIFAEKHSRAALRVYEELESAIDLEIETFDDRA